MLILNFLYYIWKYVCHKCNFICHTMVTLWMGVHLFNHIKYKDRVQEFIAHIVLDMCTWWFQMFSFLNIPTQHHFLKITVYHITLSLRGKDVTFWLMVPLQLWWNETLHTEYIYHKSETSNVHLLQFSVKYKYCISSYTTNNIFSTI